MQNPTYMYRLANDGSVEDKIFEADNIPVGWVDSPAKLKAADKIKPKAEIVAEDQVAESEIVVVEADQPKRRGRPAKAK